MGLRDMDQRIRLASISDIVSSIDSGSVIVLNIEQSDSFGIALIGVRESVTKSRGSGSGSVVASVRLRRV